VGQVDDPLWGRLINLRDDCLSSQPGAGAADALPCATISGRPVWFMLGGGGPILVNKRRAACGLTLWALSTLPVSLFTACLILTSESNLSDEQFGRMCHVRDVLLCVALFLQVGAGWLLNTASMNHEAPTAKRLRFIGLSVASVVCSFIIGILMSGLAEQGWYDVALKWFA